MSLKFWNDLHKGPNGMFIHDESLYANHLISQWLNCVTVRAIPHAQLMCTL